MSEEVLFIGMTPYKNTTVLRGEAYTPTEQPTLIEAQENQTFISANGNKEVVLTLNVIQEACNVYIYNDISLNDVNLLRIVPMGVGEE